jgi:Transketolase, N-terminal subunit
MKKSVPELRVFAEEIRLETVEMLANLGFGHIGGAMSIVETLAVLYGSRMNIDSQKPEWEERDWLVMSKGHAGPALYSTLALCGYFPKEMLLTLNKGGTNLPSHCDRNLTTGIDMTTGSLGQGMSTAIGVSLGHKMSGMSNNTYLILGDGECNEGQVWEGAMFAAQKKLNNLITLIDCNKQQLDGWTKDIIDMSNMEDRFASFGWQTQKVSGHDVEAIDKAIQAASEETDKPSAIILDTVKGKGVSFAEGVAGNHHMVIKKEQVEPEIEAIKARLESLRRTLN